VAEGTGFVAEACAFSIVSSALPAAHGGDEAPLARKAVQTKPVSAPPQRRREPGQAVSSPFFGLWRLAMTAGASLADHFFVRLGVNRQCQSAGQKGSVGRQSLRFPDPNELGGSLPQAGIVAGDAPQPRWRSSSATNEEMRILGGTSGM
jgi:hypothetical protein